MYILILRCYYTRLKYYCITFVEKKSIKCAYVSMARTVFQKIIKLEPIEII